MEPGIICAALPCWSSSCSSTSTRSSASSLGTISSPSVSILASSSFPVSSCTDGRGPEPNPRPESTDEPWDFLTSLLILQKQTFQVNTLSVERLKEEQFGSWLQDNYLFLWPSCFNLSLDLCTTIGSKR